MVFFFSSLTLYDAVHNIIILLMCLDVTRILFILSLYPSLCMCIIL